MNGLAVSATYVLPPKVLSKNVVENGHTEQTSKVNHIGKSKTSYSSIITEDDSDDDVPLQVVKATKNHKELFKYALTVSLLMFVKCNFVTFD